MEYHDDDDNPNRHVYKYDVFHNEGHVKLKIILC